MRAQEQLRRKLFGVQFERVYCDSMGPIIDEDIVNLGIDSTNSHPNVVSCDETNLS